MLQEKSWSGHGDEAIYACYLINSFTCKIFLQVCCFELILICNNTNHTQYFPDRFVKREINNLEVICSFSEEGCTWKGKFEHYLQHQEGCEYHSRANSDVVLFVGNASPTQSLNEFETTVLCDACNSLVRLCELNTHRQHCLVVLQGRHCPLVPLGCQNEQLMDHLELNEHLQESCLRHFEIIVNHIQLFASCVQQHNVSGSHDSPQPVPDERLPHMRQVEIRNRVSEEEQNLYNGFLGVSLQTLEEQVASLQAKVRDLDNQVQSLNARFEDLNFRLSLIENSNHDGSMIWKIPQFSQRKADAENGKYTSIFSLPFYTGRYGFKMCLRLYIMGDGIGKGTHLSLFFVVMRGEFDNILQWPFTHKVTFKLINQAGGRDIVDTFQPDPMSSSFRKPKSDMNIASGCPRFVSHTELERGGFIVDDTIFIKCTIDTSTIRHP